MDEELEQRGVTLESFFDQATETREMVQTVQKTSNSNLSLLNQLKWELSHRHLQVSF